MLSLASAARVLSWRRLGWSQTGGRVLVVSVCEFACKCQSFRASLWSVVGQFSLARSLVLLGSFCCCLLVIFFFFGQKARAHSLFCRRPAGRPAGWLSERKQQWARVRAANGQRRQSRHSGIFGRGPFVSGAHARANFQAKAPARPASRKFPSGREKSLVLRGPSSLWGANN